jgi:hypothetical protein
MRRNEGIHHTNGIATVEFPDRHHTMTRAATSQVAAPNARGGHAWVVHFSS